MRAIALALAVSTLGASAVRADVLDIEYKTFFGRLRKHVALGTDKKPRDLCVCQDAASPHFRYTGWIQVFEETPRVGVYCAIPNFDPDGSIAVVGGCYLFSVLGR
jgi:hypothetical protein